MSSLISIFFLFTIRLVLSYFFLFLFPQPQSFFVIIFGKLLDCLITFISFFFLLYFSLYDSLELFYFPSSFLLLPYIYFSHFPFYPCCTIYFVLFIRVIIPIFFSLLTLLTNVFLVHKMLPLPLCYSKDNGAMVVMVFD